MGDFKADIAFAVTLFPFVAVLLTLPYAVVQYRKNGSIPPLGTLLFFTFVLYCMCVYFLVVFPLPENRHVAYPKQMQLRLFAWVGELHTRGLYLSDPSCWKAIAKNVSFFLQACNLAMTVPLGFYLRYYFRRKWWQAVPIGFLVSLFFELTQLSGLYGIYDAPYRTFDVDDLFMNTLGCAVGFFLTWLVSPLLPSFERSLDRAQSRRDRVSPLRRLIGTLVDLVAATVIAGLVYLADKVLAAGPSLLTRDYALIALAMVMVLVPLLDGGTTIGQFVVRLRVVTEDGARAGRWRVAFRNFLCWFVIVPMPIYAVWGWEEFLSGRDETLFMAFAAAVFGALLVFLLARAVASHWTGSFTMLHGKLTGTRVVAS